MFYSKLQQMSKFLNDFLLPYVSYDAILKLLGTQSKKVQNLGVLSKIVRPPPLPPPIWDKKNRTFWLEIGPPPSFISLGHFGKKIGFSTPY